MYIATLELYHKIVLFIIVIDHATVSLVVLLSPSPNNHGRLQGKKQQQRRYKRESSIPPMKWPCVALGKVFHRYIGTRIYFGRV